MDVSHAEATLELGLLNAKAQDLDRTDTFARFASSGLPQEVLFRLTGLWESTRTIGGKIIHIGKIVILEIIRFIEENPNLVIGVAIGAAVGSLVSMIPYLGPTLAPLAAVLGVAVGAVAGARLDRGQEVGLGITGIGQELIILARKFFELFAAIFAALTKEFAPEM